MLRIINKVANEEQVDPKILDDAYQHCLKSIKHTLRNPLMPKVLINGFGTFRVKLPRIEWMIRGLIDSYREGKITKCELKEELTILFNIRRRLKNESNKKVEKL